MRKLMTIIAMIALPLAMQAQTKFHDVEMNDAKGPVKKITQNMMDQEQVITFTPDGKQENLTDAVYDSDGYLQSAKIEAQGMSMTMKYTWENGRIKTSSMDMMGNDMSVTNNYDDKGIVVSATMNMGGQEITIPYSDYKYDDKGNWISRKMSMMGQEMETHRTIEYYE